MGWVRNVACAVCTTIAVICAPATAVADIAAFNAAIQARDYKAAAAAAREIWPQFDRTSPDTALIAREFGFASYVAGEYAASKEYGRFLVEEGSALRTPDDLPATSLVLLRVSEFRLDPRGPSRSALEQALAARLTASGVDAISILAAEYLYNHEIANTNWGSAVSAAETATQLLQRGGPAYATRSLTAHTTAAIAAFMRGQSRDDYSRMADVHNLIVEEIDRTTTALPSRELVNLKFQAEAWTYAMEARFNTDQQTGSNIPRGVRSRTLRTPTKALFEGAPTPNTCRGRISTKEIRYPNSAEYRGFNGSVIVRLDFNEQGQVTDHEILAAIPQRAFAADIERQAPSFRMTRDSSDPRSCSLALKNYVLKIAFMIH